MKQRTTYNCEQTKRPFQRAMRSLTCFSLAVFMAIPTSLAAEGTISYRNDTEIVPGFTYSNTVATNSGGRVESFTMTLNPFSTVYPIAVQGSGLMYAGGSVEKAMAEAETLGYHVVGAINSDYFSLSTGVPTGIVIENGIYKSSPSEHSSILFSGTDVTVVGATEVPISITNQRSGQALDVKNLNKYRMDTGGLYLLNRDFSSTTRTTSEGVMVRLVPTYEELQSDNGGDLRINQPMTLTVAEVIETSFAWEIGENDYVLTAANQSGYQEMLLDFAVGDQVTMHATTWSSAIENAQWATGGGDVMVENGSLTNTNNWLHVNEGRAPRTALGVKADGSLVFYTVDGRQTGYSAGLSQLELAQHLLDEGCVSAVNLDGGGSTSFAVSQLDAPYLLGDASVQNSPSDGRLRNCATFLILVDPQNPDHLSFETAVTTVLTQSTLELGRVMVRDVNRTILNQYPTDGTMNILSNLGGSSSAIDDDGYTVFTYTPTITGEEHFNLSAPSTGLTGEQTIYVVDALDELEIVKAGNVTPITSLQLAADQALSLDFLASYNHNPVFANGSNVQWDVVPLTEDISQDQVGWISEEGYYQAGTKDALISLTLGGMTAHVEVTIEDMFEDVPRDHWAFGAIEYLYDKGLIGGVSDTEFGLGTEIRRADFMLMLYRAVGSPPVVTSPEFSDVVSTDYYAPAIAWALENNVASGLGDGSFGSYQSITREQAIAIIYKALGAMDIQLPATSLGVLEQYGDYQDIATYALPAVAGLTAQNILTDTYDMVYPQNPLMRESMALYIYHLLNFALEDLPEPTQLSLYPGELSLASGERYALLPVLTPDNSATFLNWTSSDPSAVQVDQYGVISNVFTGTGQPVVTITAKSGTLTASCVVRCVAGDTIVPEVAPDVVPDVVPDVTPEPEVAPDVVPDVVPDVTPEPEVAPDVTPDVTPEPTPDTTPEIVPDTEAVTGTVMNAPGGLNVRSGAGSDFDVVALLTDGAIVSLHGKSSDGAWYQISYQSTNPDTGVITNVQGFVMTEYIQAAAITATVINADVGLNLRSGAGTAFDVMIKIPNGTTVVILQAFTDWYKIEVLLDGTLMTGFVSADYLQLN